VRSVRHRRVERLPVGRRDAFVRLIGGGELVKDLPGDRVHLVHRVIAVTERNEGVGLSARRGGEDYETDRERDQRLGALRRCSGVLRHDGTSWTVKGR
jgi:hypothetical protein